MCLSRLFAQIAMIAVCGALCFLAWSVHYFYSLEVEELRKAQSLVLSTLLLDSSNRILVTNSATLPGVTMDSVGLVAGWGLPRLAAWRYIGGLRVNDSPWGSQR